MPIHTRKTIVANKYQIHFRQILVFVEVLSLGSSKNNQLCKVTANKGEGTKHPKSAKVRQSEVIKKLKSGTNALQSYLDHGIVLFFCFCQLKEELLLNTLLYCIIGRGDVGGNYFRICPKTIDISNLMRMD